MAQRHKGAMAGGSSHYASGSDPVVRGFLINIIIKPVYEE